MNWLHKKQATELGGNEDAGEYDIPRKGKAVGPSADLSRILALPRRPAPSAEECQEAALVLQELYGRRVTTCQCRERWKKACCRMPNAVQSWALVEMAQTDGLVGPIGVGFGKTLVSILAPMVVSNCKRAVLLVPPQTKDQLMTIDWEFYGQHWNLPNLAGAQFFTPGRPMLYVIAYSMLSSTKSSELLESIEPDLIIFDECHSVARRKDTRSSRGKRVKRYFDKYPKTRAVFLSGTLTKRSLLDWFEFPKWALKEGSPVPTHYPTAAEWAQAIDPAPFRAPFGALSKLGAPVLDAFATRVNETRGVVTSGDNDSCQAALYIRERKIEAPLKIQGLIHTLDDKWETPEGMPLENIVEVADTARELSAGYYNKWIWPRGEPKEVIDTWLAARRAYGQESREKLKRAGAGLDSPALLREAGERWLFGYTHDGVKVPPRTKNGPLPVWETETLERWIQVEDTAQPETEAVWVDDFLVRDVAAWLTENVGVAWYFGTAFGVALQKLTHLPRYGQGKDASAAIIRESGKRSIIASIKAHHFGKNLQMFSVANVCNPPAAGDVWEQLLGRHHRQGQESEEVVFEVYRHTESYRRAVDKAKELALYIQSTFKVPQKLVAKANFGW